MKKVLSVLLIIGVFCGSAAYGACTRCEWKNCRSNWLVRNARALKCAIAHTQIRCKNPHCSVHNNNNNNNHNSGCRNPQCPRKNNAQCRNPHCSVHKNGQTNGNGQNVEQNCCENENCPIHNPAKRCCNRFCVKCGKHHLR